MSLLKSTTHSSNINLQFRCVIICLRIGIVPRNVTVDAAINLYKHSNMYSQNGKFSYGYASSPGKRSSMEDFYETRIDGVEGEIVGLFGVFDGMYTCLSNYIN